MSRYSPLYDAIAKLEANNKEPELVESKYGFPFPTMYQSQYDILEKASTVESFLLSSHTGWGKTPVFLTLTRNSPSLVIEPRIFLQRQVSSYFNDYALFGRAHYKCQYASSAASAPCLLKEPCGQTNYRETCPDAKQTCMATAECKIFPIPTKTTHCKFDWCGLCGENNKSMMSHEDIEDTHAPCGFSRFNIETCERAVFESACGGYSKFPCKDCDYLEATKEAVRVIKSGGTVICNFGNFWNLLKYADTVVVDESDLFFRDISAPIILRYSNPRKNESDSIQTLLDREVKGLKTAAKDPDASFRYKATNALYNAQFLQANAELCFSYSRKDKIYIEIDPRNTNILANKLFEGKRLIIVSATPGSFDLPSYSAEIHQRCGLYFAPVGNMTSRSLKANPYLMSTAAKAIVEISDYFDLVYDNKHVIIHTGNLSTHAASLFKILGEDQCQLHQSGKLAETISDYLLSEKRYLLIASAEQGLDATWSMLQFSLKHPYSNLDEQAKTLQRIMGPEFQEYYETQARTRIIQLSGRNCRSFNSFGTTIMLDSKTQEDYAKHKDMYPQWFRSRVDSRVY